MRRVWIQAAFFAAAANLAEAGQVQVLGGEHEGFTRLVLHMPQTPKWELTENGGQAYLRLENGPHTFDLAKAFERIGRSRIEGLTATPDGLEISLACKCAISTHSDGPKLLVLDVADAPQESVSFGHSLISADGLSISSTETKPYPELPHQTIQKLPSILKQPEAASQSAQLKEVQQRLIKQLSNAAALGLVDLAETPDYGAEGKGMNPSSDEAEPIKMNVRAETSLEAGIDRESALNGYLATSGEACIPDRDLDLSRWIAGSDFSSGIASLRRTLGGEISALDDQTVIALARHYLAFGFGTEALALLRVVKPSPEADLLLSLSYVLEERMDAAPIQFQRMATCSGNVALWAVLAGLQPDTPDVDLGRVIESFSTLPEQLQIHLSPRLSQSLLEMGAYEEAQLVLRSAERQHENPSADFNFAKAQADLHEGDAEGAVLSLTASSEADAPISPSALVELIDTEIALGREISTETMALLEGYAQLYREDAIASHLIRALTSARISAGQFHEAWSMVNAIAIGDAQRVPALEEFLSSLVRAGSDLDFLRYGGALKTHAADFQAETTTQVAERFLAMGFPDLAASFLTQGRDGANHQERRLLLAEIAFKKGNLIGAKAELLGLRSEQAEQLLAKITEAERAHSVTEIPQAPAAGLPVTLARGHEALSSSQELRTRLEDLLSAAVIEE